MRIINIYLLAVYLAVLLIILVSLPKSVTQFYCSRKIVVSIGLLGLWRYSWWILHVARSLIYKKNVFPSLRQSADLLWSAGWKPKCIYFMMTTFNEVQSTTETVLASIINECKEINVPVKLFIGIGSDYDEEIIINFFKKIKTEFLFEFKLIRQKLPGKRYAIGETLRAIVEDQPNHDIPIIFMDGDTYFEPGCLQKCLPFFQLIPSLQALTTHEKAIVINGPKWLKKWLDMRFIQRDFTMQSHALSNKVLTLTGRMSIFRAKHVIEPEFITVVENDYLEHWLWGRFRFLSGDDKSTWYYLLKNKADMLYIPDATTVTIENIVGNPFDRMKENLRRWNGNTLRNGARAIALGPKIVGYFIWICLLDQRCAVWTMFIGHMIIFLLCLTKSLGFILVAFIWIAFTRLNMSFVLFYYAKRIDMSLPVYLYLNQISSAIIKIYILFRLPQQKWKNRGNQKLGFQNNKKDILKNYFAIYLTFLYCIIFLILVLIYLKIISFPSVSDLNLFFN